jgi:hypothetical protein
MFASVTTLILDDTVVLAQQLHGTIIAASRGRRQASSHEDLDDLVADRAPPEVMRRSVAGVARRRRLPSARAGA